MKLHLSNLDELLHQVRNVHPKNYLNEAVVSYRAGAYRAALITTWIAVCVDIIEKIRELAVSGEPAAVKVAETLDKINPKDPSSMLSFERDILNYACDDLELISVIEKMHLDRLKEDRNICAHPTFSDDGTQYTPNAEQALSYIVQAANYLLIQAPVKGKVVIERLFDLINETSFPSDEEKAYVVLSSEYNLGRVKESSVRNLTIILIKRLFKDKEIIAQEELNRISAALGAISRLYPEKYSEVLSEKLSQMLSEASDKQLKRLFPFLRNRKEAWSYVKQSEKIRIESLLSGMSAENIIFYEVVKAVENNPELNQVLQTTVNAFNAHDKSKLLSSISSSLFKQQAIELFIKSTNFDASEHRGKNILLPLSKHLTSSEVDEILMGACNNTGGYGYNQILPAGAIDSFFVQFYEATKVSDNNHSENWLKFWERANEKGFSYTSLNDAMLKDGLITEQNIREDDESDEDASPDEIPF